MNNYDNLVIPEHGCPRCGERDADNLRIDDNEQVVCETCGNIYKI